MNKYGLYLVCKEYIQEVREFLGQFFEEVKGRYNHDGWVSFTVPNADFRVSLMKGVDQDITQNMTFEINCKSMDELQGYSNKYGVKIESFVATETSRPYKYSYVEVLGPQNVCKVEISYSENIEI